MAMATPDEAAQCVIARSAYAMPRFVHAPQHLPVLVFRPVEGGAFRLGVDIEDALAAPGVRVRIVLHGAQSPLFALRHGVGRKRTQEAEFLAALGFYSLDPFFE